jgi:hypothetical protein
LPPAAGNDGPTARATSGGGGGGGGGREGSRRGSGGRSTKLREASGREEASVASAVSAARPRGDGEGIQKRGLPLGLGIEGGGEEEIIARKQLDAHVTPTRVCR